MAAQGVVRILIVDADREVREGMERILTTCAPFEWEFEFKAPGPEALTALKACPFDAVVSDLSEPGSEVSDVLRKAASERPEALRVVLSGYSGLEALVRSAPLAHRFLTKPTEARKLVQTLQESFELREAINCPKARALAGKVKSLPTRPKVFSRISEIMAKEDWGLSDISEAVSSDPALVAKILQIASSAAFSGSTALSSLQEAANRLGAQVMRDVTLCAETLSSFQGVRASLLDEVANRGVRVGQLASELASGEETQALARTAGLLHDVGRIVRVWRKPKSSLAIRKLSKREKLDQETAQRQVVGATDADLGAYLLGLWGLPLQLVEAVLRHREPPELCDSELVWVLAAAYGALASARGEAGVPAERFEQSGKASLYEKACELVASQAKEANTQ